MSQAQTTIQALRTALGLSPDNLPLRKLLAETLLAHGHGDEAEVEFREALRRAPSDEEAKLGLVRAFVALEKRSEAFVLLEDILRGSPSPAKAHLLHARLLHREGRIPGAVKAYRTAIRLDETVADPAFAVLLGIRGEEDDEADEDELVDGRVRLAAGDGKGGDETDLVAERPSYGFDAVGGLDDVKDEIRMKIVNPILHPELYAAYGHRTGGGILLYGPPGCGKTHLARATAGEIKAHFLCIGIHDILDMWIGASERNLHSVFEQARRLRPCVVFFDEVDALGASRSDLKGAAGRHVVNQFLDELDGFENRNEGLLVLAATNAPWHLDSAFRRPGRFDRIVFVPPPDDDARLAILKVHLRGKPVLDLDLAAIVKKTERYSGADLKAVVDLAVQTKLKEAIRRGVPAPLGTKDLVEAARKQKPSTRDWFATARNYVLYSNEGGLYDDVRPWIDR